VNLTKYEWDRCPVRLGNLEAYRGEGPEGETIVILADMGALVVEINDPEVGMAFETPQRDLAEALLAIARLETGVAVTEVSQEVVGAIGEKVQERLEAFAKSVFVGTTGR
jgi:hypothetical protein